MGDYGVLLRFAETVTIDDEHAAREVLAFLKGRCNHSYVDGGRCVLCGLEMYDDDRPTQDATELVSYFAENGLRFAVRSHKPGASFVHDAAQTRIIALYWRNRRAVLQGKPNGEDETIEALLRADGWVIR